MNGSIVDESLARPLSQAGEQSHQQCMVCGPNALPAPALKLEFMDDGDGGVHASLHADPCHQGYAGLLHGGMISTLLDAAMTHCLFKRGVEALTAQLNVRFIHPVAIGSKLELAAVLVGERRGVYLLHATLHAAGVLVAKAEGKFIRP
jgi:uncharacterized protein (TIGR00369 family)